jgi:hypothetical protein
MFDMSTPDYGAAYGIRTIDPGSWFVVMRRIDGWTSIVLRGFGAADIRVDVQLGVVLVMDWNRP